MPSLLGIDSGLTVTKAVVFDVDGTPLSVARQRVPQAMPEARHIERDMTAFWQTAATVMREALASSGRPADDIKAVAATAHGDGLYLLDADHHPVRPAILSLDSRAGDIMARWSTGTVCPEALALTGQAPHVSAPSTLLAWLKQHEPAGYSKVAHILGCKDWLRFCLCGTVGTDRTEASTAFTDVQTQAFDSRAMQLFELGDLFAALPPMTHSADIVGHVTAQAARATGLLAGTPVACGLHDVTASSLGMGGHEEGVLSVVAGTYSINEVVHTSPRIDARWMCRNALDAGRWNHMAISPASTANYDWFLDTLCRQDQQAASASNTSVHVALAPEIDAALARRSTLLFHPYLFGSPHGDVASGSFIGLRGWHDRGDLLKAVLEGIAFNHRTHIDALRDEFTFGEVCLTGGSSRNASFAQMFADVLGMPVSVTSIEEPAAFGAALCAGAAAGLYASAHERPRQLEGPARTYEPDTPRHEAYEERFAVYTRVAESFSSLWPDIESLDRQAITYTP